MEDDKTLFKWSRISEPRSYSRKNNITQPEDIEKWLERIDTAATRAVVNAAKTESRRKKPAHAASSSSAGDAVYGEARQLLSSWLTKKESAALNDGDGFHVAPQGPDRLAIKREWDRLLGPEGSFLNADEEEEEEMESVTAFSAPLSQLAAGEGLAAAAAAHEREQWDESESVEAIMKRMLARDYVDKRKLRRMEETVPTPRSDLKTKLELRQERAREVRERRRQLEEKKRQDKALKKEAEAEARKMLLEEERKRALEAKKEEEMIQMEMVRIRKEMEARHRAEEEAAAEQARIRKRQEISVKSARSGLTETTVTMTEEEQQQEEQEEEEEEEKERQSLVALQRRKDEILTALQRGDRRQASRNLKLELFCKKRKNKVLQRCFATWFSLVLDRRLQLGRAAAVADWRLLRVSFHAWRDLVRRQRLETEANAAALLAIREQKSMKVADEFARNVLLRRCFASWRQFLAQERLWRAEKALEEEKRRKMAAFLKAAATAAANEPAREERERRERQEQERQRAEDEEEERRRLEAEKEEVPLPVSPDSRSTQSLSPSVSPARRQKSSPAGHTRKTSAGSNNANETRLRSAPREVSSFEHRFRGQQEALKEQSRRLEEQARMIEELRYEQRQAELRKEVADIRAEREKAMRKPAPAVPNPAALKAEAEAEVEAEAESQSEGNSSARTENSSRVSDARSTPNKNPILLRMEQRAAERAKVKAEREERRKAAELRKAMEAAAHLEEQQRKEEEEKAARVREVRERRRAEKAAEAERQAAAERQRMAAEKAATFRRTAQLRWRGLAPWRRLLAIREEQEAQAVLHYQQQLLKRFFFSWRADVLAKRAAEDQLVRQHRERVLMQRCFNSWRLAKFYTEAMELKAENFYDLILQRRCFRAWAAEVREVLLKRWDLERTAKHFHNDRLLRVVLVAWRKLPELQREEAAREERREAIRRRVQSLVPDFRPPSPQESPLYEPL